MNDPDNSALASATVTITNAQANDQIAFANNGTTMGNIALDSFNGSVAALSSSGGTATLAEWQAALRAVTFTLSGAAAWALMPLVSAELLDVVADAVAAAASKP